mmetsp:Transcript_10298/g.21641  ORF Transcript_10298/g.21641 Transcript_10298/m.21641 type:complete len:488 (-) Transcript_10298:45-1508(-)
MMRGCVPFWSVLLFTTCITWSGGVFGAVAPPPVAPRIINGTPASAGEFPFAVYGVFCGGVLISDRFVLTAAHCTFGINSPLLLDVVDVSNTNQGEAFVVAQRYLHPSWNDVTLEYDFQLLLLNRATSVRPARLNANATVESGAQTVAIGWGVTETGRTSSVLMEATLPVRSNRACRAEYSSEFVRDVMVCAGVLDGSADSCSGDSGGPLLLENDLVVGITSFGPFPCAQEGRTGVYARVSAAVPWINGVLESFANGTLGVPSPTPSPEVQPRDSSCFAAHSVVRVGADGNRRVKRMDQLRVGDLVGAEGGVLSPVIAFSHRDPQKRESFLVFHTRNNNNNSRQLHVTRGHYLRVLDNNAAAAADHGDGEYLRVAGELRVGDFLVSEHAAREEIVRIEEQESTGVFSPLTLSGTIIVDGVVASCFTNLIHPTIARAASAPLRWLFLALSHSTLARNALFQTTAQHHFTSTLHQSAKLFLSAGSSSVFL